MKVDILSSAHKKSLKDWQMSSRIDLERRGCELEGNENKRWQERKRKHEEKVAEVVKQQDFCERLG